MTYNSARKKKAACGAMAALGVFLIIAVVYPQDQGTKTKSPPVHSVILKWKPAAGAAAYNVYRGTVSGGPYTKIGVALNETYKDTPVPSGAVFYYVVTTVNGKRESGFSEEIKVTVPNP